MRFLLCALCAVVTSSTALASPGDTAHLRPQDQRLINQVRKELVEVPVALLARAGDAARW